MRRLIRKLVLGTVSVFALGIGGAALDTALNGADAGTSANAVSIPAAIQISDSLTGDSLRKDDIRWAQVELRFRGFYTGSLDGVLGLKTRRALEQFQQNNGLSRTASLDARTWDALTNSSGIAEGSSGIALNSDSSGPITNSSPESDLGR